MSDDQESAPAYRRGRLSAAPVRRTICCSSPPPMLVIVGLLAVYTSSFAVGYHEYGDTNYFVARQAIFSLLGVGAMVFFMRIDYNRLRSLSVPDAR